MKRSVLNILLGLITLLATPAVYAQTTVSTGLTGGTSATASGVNVFGVTNNNPYAIAITSIADYHNTINNGRTYTVWYTSSQITGAPGITTANGWAQLATSPLISSPATGVTTILSNQYLVIPSGATFRIAIVVNSGTSWFATSGSNSYTNGNVTIETGSSTVSPGYAGTFPSPASTPRYFAGSITFITAAVNNVAALTLLDPVHNTQYCSYDNTPVRVVIMNNGDLPQSNFPITAKYIGTITSTITTTYTNTLAPFTKDTVVIGTINPTAGTYTIRAYTQLGTDAVLVNDTTPVANFTYKAPVASPLTHSDTVCSGGNAALSVDIVSGNTYKWYSEQTGGTLLNISNALNFNNLTLDTVMWVAALFNGCESDRVPIAAVVGPPPAQNLGNDTTFCESIPLILNAGNPGSQYLWSTGDTTQTVTVTNLSGTYWVAVTQNCTSYDTINVSIGPKPTASGISYIRMGNTYAFNASGVQNVTGYLWLFGDGATSTLPNPVHTYGPGINAALVVKLVISNICGTDTVSRSVPTGIDDLDGLDQAVIMYPNPASDQLFIRSEKARPEDLFIVDMTGRIVLRQQDLNTSTNRINIAHLPPGNYIIRVRTSLGDLSKPLQVLR